MTIHNTKEQLPKRWRPDFKLDRVVMVTDSAGEYLLWSDFINYIASSPKEEADGIKQEDLLLLLIRCVHQTRDATDEKTKQIRSVVEDFLKRHNINWHPLCR